MHPPQQASTPTPATLPDTDTMRQVNGVMSALVAVTEALAEVAKQTLSAPMPGGINLNPASFESIGRALCEALQGGGTVTIAVAQSDDASKPGTYPVPHKEVRLIACSDDRASPDAFARDHVAPAVHLLRQIMTAGVRPSMMRSEFDALERSLADGIDDPRSTPAEESQ